ncbi:cryptochrome/photolyase family protein [Roseisalinus antarcticus]|uniref:Deoxyribodipyrimidine photo-lyase-related protein n=1 Tax=Roseisalinus antarcticus TaxID=254357 RepID=A0A1Y5U0P5_9RHOB|nr:cryptochrome/photolyase family protein [Roseisalinus antarcticus]SLN75713.1 Deoxyribodipyrimidine photo-lyase-related protein [Roseisalinus antarcticus]
MTRLVLVLGDQLSPNLSALREGDRGRDVVVMAEVTGEAKTLPHHPKKVAFLFAAMRKFAAGLREDGWKVAYATLDDPGNSQSIAGELLRRAEEHGAEEVLATEPGDWRLISDLEDLPIPVHQFADDRFLCSHERFESWAKGRKSLRMEYFYREMRKATGLMMDGDKPAGGKWNYDHDNRKPPDEGIGVAGPLRFAPDAVVEEVLSLVEAEFDDHFGNPRPFWFATDREQALDQLAHWVAKGLPTFGDYQDAMVEGEPFLSHSVLSLYLNAGLLDPREVCAAVEKAWRDGKAPINAAEGFIRQVIGWREYVRGIYFLQGPDYVSRNELDHRRDLPELFWGGETRMNCLGQTIAQTRDEAYAHHIQRLMITGNFALLAGIAPRQVHDWYLAVYADAFDWVMAANTIGMSQFADGGIVASKPYVSSGSYIDRMSDYCAGCAYDVKQKTGEGACPFNLLYWDFLDRHRDRLEQNHRMGLIYGAWDRMDPGKRDTIKAESADWLRAMADGKPV